MRMLWCSILSAVLLVSPGQANPLPNPPAAGSSAQSGSEASNSLESTKTGYPLSDSVHPNGYTIKLEPHLVEGDFTFSGESNIDVIISVATNTIVLHAAGLEIEEDSTSLVVVKENALLKPTKHSPDPDNELLTIEFAEPIKVGTYTLNLKYTGTLKEEPKGFYRSARKIDGQKVWEAYTQFNPSYARRAFPCFDETAMKARFTISIKHPENYAVRSNVLTVRDTGSDNSLTQFTTTGLISTDAIDFGVYMKETAPKDTTPVAPITTTPVAPITTTPVAPITTTPVAPITTTPVAPITTTPVAPITTTPVVPITTTPVAPITTTPVAPITTTPVAPITTTPVAPITTTPVAPITTTPVAPITTTPVAPITTTPVAPITTTPVAPITTTPVAPITTTTDEPSGSSTTAEPSGSSTTDEPSGSSTTDESSGSSTTDTNDVTGAPSTTKGAANISLPTLPFTIFIGLLARLIVVQVL